MTQPGFQSLSTVYTRALRLLGMVPAQRQLQSNLTIQPVQIVADVSDFSVPHQNPLFGINAVGSAVAAEFGAVSLEAVSRTLRVRFLNVLVMTSPRMRVFARGDAILDAVTLGPIPGITLGPSVQTGTAQVRAGNNTAVNIATTAVRPTASQFDLRPPILIAKGSTLAIEDAASNTAVNVSIIWEEIPDQDATTDVGFPLLGEE